MDKLARSSGTGVEVGLESARAVLNLILRVVYTYLRCSVYKSG